MFTDRRRHRRFTGPFDALRVGPLDTPIRLYDLSRGGAFIHSMHAQPAGVQFTLKIDLPAAGWVTVTAETLPRQNDFGFAVRFLHVDPEDAVKFERALKNMEEHQPENL